MPGWNAGSYGYHGDDGLKFCSKYLGRGRDYSTIYSSGDVIGCGIVANNIFFTRNGKHLGVAFRGVALDPTNLYVMIGLHTDGEPQIKVNFGQTPFVFDLAQFVLKNQASSKPSSVKASEDGDSRKHGSDSDSDSGSGSEWLGTFGGEEEEEGSSEDDNDEKKKPAKKSRSEKGKAREGMAEKESDASVTTFSPPGKRARGLNTTSRDNSILEEIEATDEAEEEEDDESTDEEDDEEDSDGDDDDDVEGEEKKPRKKATKKSEGMFASYLERRLQKMEESTTAAMSSSGKSPYQSDDESNGDEKNSEDGSDKEDGSDSEGESAESWHTVDEEGAFLSSILLLLSDF